MGRAFSAIEVDARNRIGFVAVNNSADVGRSQAAPLSFGVDAD